MNQIRKLARKDEKAPKGGVQLLSRRVFRKASSISNIGVYAILILLIVFFAIFAKGFLSFTNGINVVRNIAIVGVAAFGEAFVLLIGGIDLSIGSIVGLSGVTAAILIRDLGVAVPLALLCGVLSGTIVGLINGFIVARLNIPPIITTLGTFTIVRGVSNLIANGMSVFGMPPAYKLLGTGYISVFPIPVVIMIAVLVILFIVLNQMPFGRYVYAIGNNAKTARISGINIPRVRTIVFIISGTAAGIAGVLLSSRLDSGQAVPITNFEMDVITAVVLGGISISGGKGRFMGVLIGVLIIGVLQNGLILKNVLFYSQMVIKGPVLLLAIGLDILSQKTLSKYS
jgi:ribose transport system permease protein